MSCKVVVTSCSISAVIPLNLQAGVILRVTALQDKPADVQEVPALAWSAGSLPLPTEPLLEAGLRMVSSEARFIHKTWESDQYLSDNHSQQGATSRPNQRWCGDHCFLPHDHWQPGQQLRQPESLHQLDSLHHQIAKVGTGRQKLHFRSRETLVALAAGGSLSVVVADGVGRLDQLVQQHLARARHQRHARQLQTHLRVALPTTRTKR